MKLTTILAIFFVAIGLVHCEKRKMFKEFEGLMGQCIKEMDVPEELLKRMKDVVTEEDKKTRGCLKACVFRKAEIIQSSKLSKDKLIEFMEKFDDDENHEKMQQIISHCHDEVQNLEDECEMIDKFTECFEHEKSA